ncbi:MAG: RNA polymerase sigma factor [Ruminococcus sp.]|nr:RNA polymerase sigma factor [Ruminococcus sp.]
MEDNQIILLFNQRNEHAITEITEKYGELCRKTASRILETKQDVDECVNDALMQMWNCIPPNHPTNLVAFLITITRNIALDRHKYNTRHKRGKAQINLVLDELSDCIHSSEDVEESIEERLLVQSIERFLDTLSYDARTIFVQRYLVMLSVNEITIKYNLSVSKVKVTLMRVRQKLRKYLKQEGWL